MRQAYAASFLADERTAPVTLRRRQADGTPVTFTTLQPDSLTMNERAILVFMCSTAHDGDKPPRYWGGRDALARHALGRIVPEEISGDSSEAIEARKARESIHESVRQALAGLVARGFIERIGSAFPGRAQEYAIRVDNLTSTQGDLRPFSRSPWVNSKMTLVLGQGVLAPETQNTQTPREHPESPGRVPHVRPVSTTEVRANDAA